MTTSARTIDDYLGLGWYTEWQEMSAQAERATRRFEFHEARLKNTELWDEISVLKWDIGVLEAVDFDYKQGMDLIARGARVDREELGGVHDVYTLALGVVEAETEALDVMLGGGLAIAFAVFPFALVKLKAQTLQKSMLALEKELERAEGEVSGAWIQTLLNTSVAVIHVAVPHLGLLARSGIFVGQFVADVALGPPKPVVKKGAAVVVHGAAALEESVEALHALGKKGAVATGGGALLLDLEEVATAYRRRDNIKNLISAVNTEYADLMKLLDKHSVHLKQITRGLQNLQRAISNQRDNAWYIRDARNKEMRRIGYTARQAKVWRQLR